ncbi:MAG: HAD family hydrolase [Chitinophagaceae bacterium]
MQGIKNIIFDLGGVFLTLDYQKTETAFEALGIHAYKSLFKQHYSSPLFEELETGKITEAEFYNAFREITQSLASNEAIKNAWNAMLLHFPKERLEWLEKIKDKYNIYLFSNTNQIHYDAFMEIFGKEHPGKNFNNFFIKAYYSQFLGLRKPTVESYEAILKEQQLNAAETLFIDDTYINIEGAAKAGLQTIWLKAPTTLLDLNL